MKHEYIYRTALSSPEYNLAAEKITSCRDQDVLIVSHDDPDGICSAVMLARALHRLGVRSHVRLPPRFMLSADELREYAEACGLSPQGRVFCLDKGVSESYDELTEVVEDVVIIDHHPPQGIPRKVLVVNPSLESWVRASTTHVLYMVLVLAGLADEGDVIADLLGLTGDFALKTVPEEVASLALELVDHARSAHPHLFESRQIRPTMFDVKQRRQTSLLHQITELVHAVSGGGFQFFYGDRNVLLEHVDPPRHIFNQLLGYLTAGRTAAEDTLEEFIAALPDPQLTELMFRYYLEDWEKYSSLLQASVEIVQLGKVHVYLFIGDRIKLTPMLGSVKLHEMAERLGHQHAIIIIVNVKMDCLHVSMRGTGEKLHCGQMCGNLATRLRERLHIDQVSGGGHPVAAELVVREDGVPPLSVIKEIMDYLGEVETIAGRASNDAARKVAADLGLADPEV
ncbi:DHH family phosphoesterase [bacterium]|nr:DHH family phosphoesterase [candidate division CSSED10-310 bacterium]